MHTQSKMIVTNLELMDDESSADAGLVLATAEVVSDWEAVTTVSLLTNIKDGWWIGREVTVTVEWEEEGVHTIERSFAIGQLSPEDFTEESVRDAAITEPDL